MAVVEIVQLMFVAALLFLRSLVTVHCAFSSRSLATSAYSVFFSAAPRLPIWPVAALFFLVLLLLPPVVLLLAMVDFHRRSARPRLAAALLSDLRRSNKTHRDTINDPYTKNYSLPFFYPSVAFSKTPKNERGGFLC